MARSRRITYQISGPSTVVLLGKRRQIENSRCGRKMFPSRPPVKAPNALNANQRSLFSSLNSRATRLSILPESARLDAVVGSSSLLFDSADISALSENCGHRLNISASPNIYISSSGATTYIHTKWQLDFL
jgi:hypothetical protein